MKKRLIPLFMSLFLLTGCGDGSGLPFAREMGDMALLRTMGVDRGEDGGLLVTVSTGRRARGLQQEAEPPLLISAAGGSLSEACLTIQGQSDNYVFYGYVDQLLLGEELAKQGVEQILNYYARDLELSLGAQVWVVRGTARATLDANQEEGVEGQLSVLQTGSEIGAAGIARTAGELLSDLEEGSATFLPMLQTVDDGEAALVETGYVVFRGEKLVGVLEGELAKGVELLMSHAPAGVIQGELPARQDILQERQVHTAYHPVFQGDELVSVEIRCQVTADLTEFSDKLSNEQLELLRQKVEQREETRIRMALTALQGWDADCISLGRKLGINDPAHWNWLEEHWEDLFAQISFDVIVEATIRCTYGAI